MIITPHFVFLHLHKSGGTFVNHILTTIFPNARTLGYHAPRSAIPEPLQHLPVVGTIRNPWSYYVSWYFFQKGRQQPNALFRTVSENGRLDFNATITNLVELGTSPAHYDRLVAELPDERPNRGLNLNKTAVRALNGYSSGFYSYLTDYMYDDLNSVVIMKMETLRDDLLRVLRELGVPIDDGITQMIRGEKKRNTSRHGEYSGYYDTATRMRVAHRDGALIERFGYRFDS